MVNGALSIGAAAGILLSAGFVYWEVGRYAAPQVPETRFDERKEVFAYTAGLFVGVLFVVPFLFLFQSIPQGLIGGVVLYLALLVGGTELAQWLLLRSNYFGSDGSGPFYALGFRAAIGGILVIGLVTQYVSAPNLTILGGAAAVAESVAIVSLEAAGGILAIPGRGVAPALRGGPLSAIPLEAVGFFFLGLAAGIDPTAGIAGGIIIAIGAAALYRSIAPPTLSTAGAKVRSEELPVSPFRRTDR